MHNRYLQQIQQLTMASLAFGFVVFGLMVPTFTTALAADGIVVLQREVPARPAVREGEPGRAVTIDTSPDDKIKTALGQSIGVKPIELNDAEFSAVSTNTPRSLNIINDSTKLSGEVLNSYGLGNTSSPDQSSTPALSGSIGGAVGGAVSALPSQINAGLNGASNALNGMTGAIMHSTGR